MCWRSLGSSLLQPAPPSTLLLRGKALRRHLPANRSVQAVPSLHLFPLHAALVPSGGGRRADPAHSLAHLALSGVSYRSPAVVAPPGHRSLMSLIIERIIFIIKCNPPPPHHHFDDFLFLIKCAAFKRCSRSASVSVFDSPLQNYLSFTQSKKGRAE